MPFPLPCEHNLLTLNDLLCFENIKIEENRLLLHDACKSTKKESQRQQNYCFAFESKEQKRLYVITYIEIAISEIQYARHNFPIENSFNMTFIVLR